MNRKIGILDSGIGGTTILKEIRKLLPNEDYIYYADTKNNPYGEKKKEEIEAIVKEIVDYLMTIKNCKMIVIACNTATTTCMKKLKQEYQDMIFIGTVPAIKVACDYNYKNTLVLATPRTIHSERTSELIKDNKRKDQKIILKPCDGLAHAIETNDQETIEKILAEIKQEVKSEPIDSIVLGCTHYPLIKDTIEKFFPEATLLDGSYGVAKEVKRQLELHNLLNKNGKNTVEYIDTKSGK